MADLQRGLPGATPTRLEEINEIVRGATIRQITPDKKIDPDQGGECVRIELIGGDALILIAVPGNPLAVGEPTARIQPLLVTRRGSRLKGLPT